MAGQLVRSAGGGDFLITYVTTLGDIIKDILTFLGGLVGNIRGTASTFESISNEIAQTNASFAMEFINLSKELKLLDIYYTKVYMQTKAMVEFGIDEKIIPNIKKLIDNNHYEKAIKEISSFIDILAKRIKDIMTELKKHDEKVALSKELQERIQGLNEDLNTSNEYWELQVENKQQAEYYRIGKNMVALVSMSATGMLMYGNNLTTERIEQAVAYLERHPQTLSLLAERGMALLDDLTSTSGDNDTLRRVIKENTDKMSTQFCNYFEYCSKIEIQISVIVNDTQRLEECMKGLKEHIEDSDATGGTNSEWVNVSVTLQEMLDLFKNLEREVVEKKIT